MKTLNSIRTTRDIINMVAFLVTGASLIGVFVDGWLPLVTFCLGIIMFGVGSLITGVAVIASNQANMIEEDMLESRAAAQKAADKEAKREAKRLAVGRRIAAKSAPPNDLPRAEVIGTYGTSDQTPRR